MYVLWPNVKTATTPENTLTQILLALAFNKCVLSLGISETFLHTVRVFYLHLALKTHSFTGLFFNKSIKLQTIQV